MSGTDGVIMKRRFLIVGCVAVLGVLAWLLMRAPALPTVSKTVSTAPGIVVEEQSGLAADETIEPSIEAVVASVAEAPQAPDPSVEPSPVDGLWFVESYTWEGLGTGPADEVFPEDAVPMFRVDSDGVAISFSLLEPWTNEAPFGSFSGEREGRVVRLTSGTRTPFVVEGAFTADWKRFSGSGAFDVPEEPPARATDAEREIHRHLKSDKMTIALVRIEDLVSGPILSADELLKQTREEMQALADALRAYADDHDGQLPTNLRDLVPDYLSDYSQIEDTDMRAILYAGGRLPPGLLTNETPWEEFKTEMPMRERLAAWEAYQQERWGAEQPLLPPVLTMRHGELERDFHVDALGRVTERPFWHDEVNDWESPELRINAMNDLKQVGLSLMMFLQEHDGYLPAGLTSLYPLYLTDHSLLTHPSDSPGTASYAFVLPLVHRSEIVDPGNTPVLIQRLDGTQPERRQNVIFMDGHVESFTPDGFAERYPEWVAPAIPKRRDSGG